MKQSRMLAVLAAVVLAATPALAADEVGTPDAGTIVGTPDVEFMKAAAQTDMEEIATGELAQEKSQNEAVKEFAAQMIAEHSRNAREQVKLSRRLRMALPMSLYGEHKANVEMLSALEGEAFDRAYVEAMVKGHEKALNMFRREAGFGWDPDVRAFAAKALPSLQMHYEHAVALHKGMRQNRR